jgi:hypothetical protein
MTTLTAKVATTPEEQNLAELVADSGVFLHASPVELEIGTILRAGTERRAPSEIETIFEALRPGAKPSRHSSVFMARDIGVIETMGLADDACIYFVRPGGNFHQFDAAWLERATDVYNEASGIPTSVDLKKIQRCARAYWKGRETDPYGSKFEVLSQRAEVLAVF